jgi:hypothetical protein
MVLGVDGRRWRQWRDKRVDTLGWVETIDFSGN